MHYNFYDALCIDLDFHTAFKLLKKNFTDAYFLGVNLKIRHSILAQLQRNHGVNDLYQILDYWLKQNPESPWQELAEAVRGCNDHRTALEIENMAEKSGFPVIKSKYLTLCNNYFTSQ